MRQGDQFSEQFTVTGAVYNGFMTIFNDRNPVHTDDVFAKAHGFAGKVMHGNILGGFLSYFIGECLPVKNVVIHLQEIKYLKPVYLDDELQLKATLAEVYESVDTFVFSFTFENQKQVRVAKGKIQIGIVK